MPKANEYGVWPVDHQCDNPRGHDRAPAHSTSAIVRRLYCGFVESICACPSTLLSSGTASDLATSVGGGGLF